MNNSVRNGQAFTSNLLTANVVMIPKPDRDHSSWANFRPIFLINIDMKILTKILVYRLNPFLPRLIQKDQVALVLQQQAGDAIGRIIQLQHIAHSRSLATMLSMSIRHLTLCHGLTL